MTAEAKNAGGITRRRFLRNSLAAGLGLGLWPLLGASSPPSSGLGRALCFSDLHFNPFFDSSLLDALSKADYRQWEGVFQGSAQGPGGYGSEADYALFSSLLDNAAARLPDPDFLIFPGDFLRHDFNATYDALIGGGGDRRRGFIDKTTAFIASQIQKRFPSAPTYFSLGNNDSYCGDYQIQPQGPFLKNSAAIFQNSLLAAAPDSGSFGQTYPQGGYYRLAPPGPRAGWIVSLNTILFSSNYQDACGPGLDHDPAALQLDWLEAQLALAQSQGRGVWLLLHIPPGVNVYGSLHKYLDPSGKLTAVQMMWRDEYLTRFMDIISRHGAAVRASLAGHTHMDDFRLAPAGGFVHICPAVSPVFGNNPAYEIISYDRDSFGIRDYQVFYLNLENRGAAWAEEYMFNRAYDRAADAAGLAALHQAMARPGRDRDRYIAYYNVSRAGKPAMDAKSFRAFWCGIDQWQGKEFLSCFNAPPPR